MKSRSVLLRVEQNLKENNEVSTRIIHQPIFQFSVAMMPLTQSIHRKKSYP